MLGMWDRVKGRSEVLPRLRKAERDPKEATADRP